MSEHRKRNFPRNVSFCMPGGFTRLYMYNIILYDPQCHRPRSSVLREIRLGTRCGGDETSTSIFLRKTTGVYENMGVGPNQNHFTRNAFSPTLSILLFFSFYIYICIFFSPLEGFNGRANHLRRNTQVVFGV